MTRKVTGGDKGDRLCRGNPYSYRGGCKNRYAIVVGVKGKNGQGMTAWGPVAAAAAGLTGMAIFIVVTGCATAPTKVETRIFKVTTNTVPVVELVTNVLAVSPAGVTSRVESVAGFSPSVGAAGSGSAAGSESRPYLGGEDRPARRAGPTWGGGSARSESGPYLGTSEEKGTRYITNVSFVTNWRETYQYEVGPGAQSVATVAGTQAGCWGGVGRW